MIEESAPLAELSDADFKEKLAELLTLAQEELKFNQLLHYTPVSAVGVAIRSQDWARRRRVGAVHDAVRDQQRLDHWLAGHAPAGC